MKFYRISINTINRDNAELKTETFTECYETIEERQKFLRYYDELCREENLFIYSIHCRNATNEEIKQYCIENAESFEIDFLRNILREL